MAAFMAAMSFDFLAPALRDVGCGSNRVDVAVRDPDGDGYVMGVMCDGRSYAGERTVRDRDRLRDEVFGSLGWNIRHVWVEDWAYDRERAEKRLVDDYMKTLKGKEKK